MTFTDLENCYLMMMTCDIYTLLALYLYNKEKNQSFYSPIRECNSAFEHAFVKSAGVLHALKYGLTTAASVEKLHALNPLISDSSSVAWNVWNDRKSAQRGRNTALMPQKTCLAPNRAMR